MTLVVSSGIIIERMDRSRSLLRAFEVYCVVGTPKQGLQANRYVALHTRINVPVGVGRLCCERFCELLGRTEAVLAPRLEHARIAVPTSALFNRSAARRARNRRARPSPSPGLNQRFIDSSYFLANPGYAVAKEIIRVGLLTMEREPCPRMSRNNLRSCLFREVV